MKFIVDGEEMEFRGTITIVSADNLAAQVLGGYKALSAAFRKCRTCMAIDVDMQTKITILNYGHYTVVHVGTIFKFL